MREERHRMEHENRNMEVALMIIKKREDDKRKKDEGQA